MTFPDFGQQSGCCTCSKTIRCKPPVKTSIVRFVINARPFKQWWSSQPFIAILVPLLLPSIQPAQPVARVRGNFKERNRLCKTPTRRTVCCWPASRICNWWEEERGGREGALGRGFQNFLANYNSNFFNVQQADTYFQETHSFNRHAHIWFRFNRHILVDFWSFTVGEARICPQNHDTDVSGFGVSSDSGSPVVPPIHHFRPQNFDSPEGKPTTKTVTPRFR